MFGRANPLAKKGDVERIEFLKWLKRMRPEAAVPEISVVIWDEPTVEPRLPRGKRAVYSFHHAGRTLKVGVAGGPNAGTRYNYQHYRCDPQSSTLANDIVKAFPSVGPSDVGVWIRENTVRIDFLLPTETPDEIVDALERQLIYRWDPRFEGRRRGRS